MANLVWKKMRITITTVMVRSIERANSTGLRIINISGIMLSEKKQAFLCWLQMTLRFFRQHMKYFYFASTSLHCFLCLT